MFWKNKIKKKVIFVDRNQLIDMQNNLKKLIKSVDDPDVKGRFINCNFLIDKEWLTVLCVDRKEFSKNEKRTDI